ncbi:MAG: glutamate--tRNA ligase [Methylocystaceae bacterium]|nr:glutamate--tRNA ligase [Methylocystaceae bacterium]
MTSPIVRFAPSPTGLIHIGNARVALFNELFAKANHGRFILRFDDTDSARSTAEFARAIEVDLAWLGIRPDAIFRQSDRSPDYEAAAAKLRESGRLYPCYETAEELEKRRKMQQARGLPPVYDRAALRLTPEERKNYEDAGRRPHWRFKLAAGVIDWNDLIRGPTHIDCAALSDPVLIREDGSFLYTLPSVVDDIDMKITHVIRGEDHVTNTAVQLQIFSSLSPNAPAPIFAHHNLLISASGEGLSKRTGSLSISSLREEGYEAMAVAALATLTGSSDNVHANPARFDPHDLETLTHRTLALLEFEDVRERLAALEIVGHKAEPLWRAARGNLARFDEIKKWWRVIDAEITPVQEDADFLKQAAGLLPPEPWGEQTWAAWTQEIKSATGRKGKALFHPLRLALTGEESGPELALLLPLIGHATVIHRLIN